MARDINPELQLTVFEGVTEHNSTPFWMASICVSTGLISLLFRAQAGLSRLCAAGIPATTVAPAGMGAALLNFLPGRMTFEEYFRWDGCSDDDMALRFLIGLSPAMLQRGYLVDPTAVDFKARKGPSTVMACDICAGMAATEALKILLHRGEVVTAPHGVHFDAYRNKLVRTWRPWGNRNPIQRLTLAVARRQLGVG